MKGQKTIKEWQEYFNSLSVCDLTNIIKSWDRLNWFNPLFDMFDGYSFDTIFSIAKGVLKVKGNKIAYL